MLSKEQLDMVSVLRANISQGWPKKLNKQLKEAAALESENI